MKIRTVVNLSRFPVFATIAMYLQETILLVSCEWYDFWSCEVVFEEDKVKEGIKNQQDQLNTLLIVW
jgi:hypothetical protein